LNFDLIKYLNAFDTVLLMYEVTLIMFSFTSMINF